MLGNDFFKLVEFKIKGSEEKYLINPKKKQNLKEFEDWKKHCDRINCSFSKTDFSLDNSLEDMPDLEIDFSE